VFNKTDNYDAFRTFVSKAYPNKVIIEFTDYFAQGRRTNKSRQVIFDLDAEKAATAKSPLRASIFVFRLANLGYRVASEALPEWFDTIAAAEHESLPPFTTLTEISSEEV
jgi:hypothetical protein